MVVSCLPYEIINKILQYDGNRIKYRNGKYMNQISRNDYRYDLLKKIQRPDIVPGFIRVENDGIYTSIVHVKNAVFCVEKWYSPITDRAYTEFEYNINDINKYTYIQDDICYIWNFYKTPSNQVKSFFERMLFLFFEYFVPF